MYRVCKKCGKKIENLTVFRCPVCEETLPMEFMNDKIDTSCEKKWFIQCGSCGKWISFLDRNNIPNVCSECFEIGLSNNGEDSVISEEEYLERIGEKHAKSNVKEKNINAFSETRSQEEIKYVELVNERDGKVIRVNHGEYMLGAKGDIESEYFYPLKFVSGKHFMIFVEKTQVLIQDNDSKNKTRINGQFISRQDGRIRTVTGDKISMADQVFEVKICK